MLPSVMPAKSERTGTGDQTSRKMQKVVKPTRESLPRCAAESSQLDGRRRALVASISAPSSPKVNANTSAPYSAPVSPVQISVATPSGSSMRTSWSEPNMVEVAIKAETEVNSNYYDSIVDHDYCQNVPGSCQQESPNKNSMGSPPQKASLFSDAINNNDPDGSMLKSLLLNKNLADELKRQAAQERAQMVRKVSVNLDHVDMDIDEADTGRYSRFDNERHDLPGGKVVSGIVVGKPPPPLPPLDQLPKDSEKIASKRNHIKLPRIPKLKDRQPKAPIPVLNKNRRHYRKKDQVPSSEEEDLFDKLPNYFTALSKPIKPDKAKSEANMKLYNGVPGHDRDPSPERDVTYSKLPAYYSCFTNSTKYDESGSEPIHKDQNNAKPLWEDQPRSQVDSRASSRSQTPSLVIASQANSESRSSSRGRSRSRSSSSSHESSCSSSSSSSDCPQSLSPSQSQPLSGLQSRSRRQAFRRNRHSYSSSPSSSR